MKRPVGVILTSIVLGLCAGFQLLSAALVGLGAFAMRHAATATLSASTPPPGTEWLTPGIMTSVMLLYGAFLVALAAWAIITLVGLLRLKNWARYSVLVIGGCMAGLGVMMAFGMLVAATMMPTNPEMAKLPAHTMQGIFWFEGIIFAGFAGIGVWWLIYFNLRKTKALFVPTFPLGFEPAYVLDPATFPEIPGAAPPPPPYPPASAYPLPGRFSKVPTPVIVVGCLSLLGGVVTLPYLFLPFPAFIGGFILPPIASHVFYFAMALLALGLGAGLLRLDNSARIGVNAVMAFGVLNMLILLTPWGRGRLLAFNSRMYEQMHMPGLADRAGALYSGPLIFFSAGLGLVVYGVVAWILYRYREAFLKLPAGSDQAAG